MFVVYKPLTQWYFYYSQMDKRQPEYVKSLNIDPEILLNA